MPNEVFLRTRAGLTALVSTRAAGRILEGALKGSGHNPDDVNLPQMRSALLGPVLQELEGVLPRAGLRRNLERLARSLRPVAAPAADLQELTDTEATPCSEEPAPQSESQSATPGPAESHPDDVDEIGDNELSDSPPTPALPVGTVTATPAASVVRTPLATQDLERHVQRFTQIEHVRLVTVIRGDGTAALSRGDGPDPALLARLSRLALTLLAKGGEIRQVHLGHTAGQLFLYPLGPDLLVIVGGVELNLGTVNTAFTALALEEDL